MIIIPCNYSHDFSNSLLTIIRSDGELNCLLAAINLALSFSAANTRVRVNTASFLVFLSLVWLLVS